MQMNLQYFTLSIVRAVLLIKSVCVFYWPCCPLMCDGTQAFPLFLIRLETLIQPLDAESDSHNPLNTRPLNTSPSQHDPALISEISSLRMFSEDRQVFWVSEQCYMSACCHRSMSRHLLFSPHREHRSSMSSAHFNKRFLWECEKMLFNFTWESNLRSRKWKLVTRVSCQNVIIGWACLSNHHLS